MELTPELEALMHARSLYMGTQEPQVIEQAPAEFAGAAEVVPPQTTVTETPLAAPPEPAAPVAPQQPMLIPTGGSVSSSSSRTVRRKDVPAAPKADGWAPLVDEYRKLGADVADVRQDRQDTLQDQADAQQGMADVEDSTTMRQAAEAENMARLEAQLSGNRDARVAQKQAEIEQRMAEIPTVDPGRMWKNAGALGSAAGIISAAIGGYLAVRQGRGGNDALDQINKVIEQDVHAQEQDIWNQKYKIDQLGKQKDDIFKDAALKKAERAEQFAYRKMSIAAEMGVYAAKFKSASKQAEYLEMQLKLQEEAFKDSQEAVKFYTDVYSKDAGLALQAYQAEEAARRGEVSQSSSRSQQFSVSAGAGGSAAGEVFAHSTFADPTGKKPTYALDPRIGLSEAEESKIRVRFESQGNIIRELQDYDELVKRIGRTYAGPGKNIREIGSEDRKMLESKRAEVMGNIRYLATGAAANEKEFEETIQKVGAMMDWTNVDTTKARASYIDEWRMKRQGTVDTYGIHDIDTRKKVDVHGETHREDIVDVSSKSNALGAARDAATRVFTSKNSAQVADNLGALADYVSSPSAMSALLPGVVAGQKESADGVEQGFEANDKTRDKAIARVKLVIARHKGDAKVKAEGERLIERLKDRESGGAAKIDAQTTKAFEGINPKGGRR